MRKSILAMFVVMVAIFAVACGGNKANGNAAPGNGASTDGAGGGGTVDPVAQWKELYKKGRTWTTKTSMDNPKMVSYSKVEVLDVNDKEATIKTTMLKEDKTEMMAGTESKVPVPGKTETTGKTEGPAPKMSDDKVKVEAGEFDCTKIEMETAGKKTTTWMDKKTGAMVKMEAEGMKMELVEFK